MLNNREHDQNTSLFVMAVVEYQLKYTSTSVILFRKSIIQSYIIKETKRGKPLIADCKEGKPLIGDCKTAYI